MDLGESKYKKESSLVREALVREIRDADRWMGVMEAWNALLNVRRMAKNLIEERERHSHSPCTTKEDVE